MWMGPGMGMWTGRKRRFRRGMLKFVILKLLEHDERHGYEMMRHFAERGWGRLAAGTLYPVLAALEEAGWVEGRDEGGRRTYRITDLGKKHLRDVASDLEGELEDEDTETTSETQGAPGTLRDAMRRLSGAVMQAAQNAKPETAQQISGRLDALRKEIYTLLANE